MSWFIDIIYGKTIIETVQRALIFFLFTDSDARDHQTSRKKNEEHITTEGACLIAEHITTEGAYLIAGFLQDEKRNPSLEMLTMKSLQVNFNQLRETTSEKGKSREEKT